jgi:hypothetical protein
MRNVPIDGIPDTDGKKGPPRVWMPQKRNFDRPDSVSPQREFDRRNQQTWIAENNRKTGLDRKTIRAIRNGEKVKASTLAKVVIGRKERFEECQYERPSEILSGDCFSR